MTLSNYKDFAISCQQFSLFRNYFKLYIEATSTRTGEIWLGRREVLRVAEDKRRKTLIYCNSFRDAYIPIVKERWQVTNIYGNGCRLPQTCRADLGITRQCICSRRRPSTLIWSICRKSPHLQPRAPVSSGGTAPAWPPRRRSGSQTEALQENKGRRQRESGRCQTAIK